MRVSPSVQIESTFGISFFYPASSRGVQWFMNVYARRRLAERESERDNVVDGKVKNEDRDDLRSPVKSGPWQCALAQTAQG